GRVVGREAVDAHDLPTPREALLGEMRPDESGHAGYQHALHAPSSCCRACVPPPCVGLVKVASSPVTRAITATLGGWRRGSLAAAAAMKAIVAPASAAIIGRSLRGSRARAVTARTGELSIQRSTSTTPRTP